jgi:hypothetical protein
MLLRRAREDARGYPFPTGLILAWVLPILIVGALPFFINGEDGEGELLPPATETAAVTASAALDEPAPQPTARVVGSTASPRAQGAPAPSSAVSDAALDRSTPRNVVATGGEAARLRQTPSLEAGVVALLVDGTEVRVLGPERAEGGRLWREVTSPSGDRGWIEQGLLRSPASAVPEQTR